MPPRALTPSPGLPGAARCSPCGAHRLLLERRWAPGPTVGFVMLNPSTADAAQDDPTLRRCIGFARSWGFGGLLVANLFTLRATDPRDLMRATPEGRTTTGADEALTELATRSDLVIEAWGAHHLAHAHASAARTRLASAPAIGHLGHNRDGSPRHPLYVAAATAPLDRWSGRPIALPRDTTARS